MYLNIHDLFLYLNYFIMAFNMKKSLQSTHNLLIRLIHMASINFYAHFYCRREWERYFVHNKVYCQYESMVDGGGKYKSDFLLRRSKWILWGLSLVPQFLPTDLNSAVHHSKLRIGCSKLNSLFTIYILWLIFMSVKLW